MIKSNFHFKVENGRLKVDEAFVSKEDKGIRLHNKLFGFLLWLIGKASFIETLDSHGKTTTWIINKNSYLQWIPSLAPQGKQFDKKDIDALLQAVKLHVELMKEKKTPEEKKAPEQKKAPVDKKASEDKKAPEQKKAPVDKKASEEKKIDIPNEAKKVEEKQPLQKQDVQALMPLEEAKKFITSTYQQKLPWNEETIKGLENFVAKGGLDKHLLQALSSDEQQKLFTCLLRNDLDQEAVYIKQMIGALPNNQEQLISFFKILEPYYSDFKTFFGIIDNKVINVANVLFFASGAFDRPVLENLPQEQQNFLAKLLSSNLFHQSVTKVTKNCSPAEKQQINKLFEACIYLIFEKNYDADKGIKFLSNFMHDKIFADVFLSLNRAQLLAVESSFELFKNEAEVAKSLSLFNPAPLTIEKRQKYFFLGLLANIFKAYKKDEDFAFSQIREKIKLLKDNYPWLTLPVLHKRPDVFEAMIVDFTADEILNEFQHNNALAVRAKYSQFYGVKGQEIHDRLPKLIFENTPNHKQAEALLLYPDYDSMILDHVNYVMETNNPEIIKLVFRQFLSIIKTQEGSARMFAQLNSKIDKKEHLLYMLGELKKQDFPDKDLFLQVISGGFVNYFKQPNVLYKPNIEDEQIKTAFKEMGLGDKYSNQPIN